jgi:hypothetical protein
MTFEDGKSITNSGGIAWCKNGLMHRVSSPAYSRGRQQEWSYSGRFHRLKGPAINYFYRFSADGDPLDGPSMSWYIHGHRAADKAQFYNKSWRRKALLKFMSYL